MMNLASVIAQYPGVRVLVCGSRSWNDMPTITKILRQLKPSVVIHGGALGADSLGGMAAWGLKIPIERYPAEWAKYGRMAGLVRNQQMLDEGKPQLVLAFWDRVSRGTADMVERAERTGIPVYITDIVHKRPLKEVPVDV